MTESLIWMHFSNENIMESAQDIVKRYRWEIYHSVNFEDKV